MEQREEGIIAYIIVKSSYLPLHPCCCKYQSNVFASSKDIRPVKQLPLAAAFATVAVQIGGADCITLSLCRHFPKAWRQTKLTDLLSHGRL